MKRLDPKILNRYVDQELDPSRAEAVEEALKTDDLARNELDQVRKLGQAIRLGAESRTDEKFLEGLWDRVHESVASPTGKKRSLWERLTFWYYSVFRKPAWPYALGLSACVLIAVVFWLFVHHRVERPRKATFFQETSNQLVLENVDYTGSPPTVFQIPDAEGDGSTTVIWVTDNEGVDEDTDPGQPSTSEEAI